MALFTVDCNFYPQQPLFRYFYFVTGRDTVVRNKKQVVFPENLRVVFQNIVDAQIVACFFISDKEQAQIQVRRNRKFLQGMGNEQAACQTVLIVFNSPSDKSMVLF